MKMFLTRIGFGSKVVVTGDMTQRDLPKDQQSGLEVARKVLAGIDDIAMIELSSVDIVRHPLVQKIVNAYDAYDAKMEKMKKPMDHRPPADRGGDGTGERRGGYRRSDRGGYRHTEDRREKE